MYIKVYEDWRFMRVVIDNPAGRYEGFAIFLFERKTAFRYGLRLILAALGLCRKARLHSA